MNRHYRALPSEHETIEAEPMPPLASPGAPRRNILRALWRRRLIILVVTLLGAAGAFAYLSRLTPIYASTARLYVEQRRPRVIGMEDLGTSVSNLHTQCELIRSSPILTIAAETQGLSDLQTFRGVRPEAMAGRILGGLSARVGRNDELIYVSYESPYASDAPQIVNAVVDAFVLFHARQKRSTAAEVLAILQREKAKADLQLGQFAEQMLRFRQANPDLAFDGGGGNVVFQRLAALSEKLTAAQLETIDAEAAHRAAQAIVDDPVKLQEYMEAQQSLGQPPRDAEIARLRAELHAIEMQLVTEMQTRRADHINVRTLEAQKAQILTNLTAAEQEAQQRRENFASTYLANALRGWEVAQEKEAQVRTHYETERSRAIALNDRMAELTKLQGDYEQVRNLSDLLGERIKEINLTEDTGAMNISVLDAASRPGAPSKPDKRRIASMGLGLGLVAGILLALLRDRLDPRIRSAQEVSFALGLPVVGAVPSIKGGRGMQGIVTRGQQALRLPRSDVAEAYRSIRTALFLGVPDGQARSILVTSPERGEGKSTLVSNLGIAIAQSGKRTLVLDADFRAPRQRDIFQLEDGAGLAEVLQGTAQLEDVVRPTHVEGLDVLPCGEMPGDPSELLHSPQVVELLQTLETRYDQVLIDSAPVMAVTDTLVFSTLADLTLLVLRAERSNLRVAEMARESLLNVGASLFGIVVNDVPRGRRRYGYSSSYGYNGAGYPYYGYGHRGRQPRLGRQAALPTLEPADGQVSAGG